MKRPCLKCGRLIKRGSYCKLCEPRGGTAEQGRFRQRVLAQTAGCCARCGSDLDVQAHHLHPIGEGGARDGPGEPLCAQCHKLEHKPKERR